MDIRVIDRRAAEHAKFDRDDWVISINDDPEALAKLSYPQAYLQLCFADVDAGGSDAMDSFDAERILRFAVQANEQGKRLWIHCTAGVSRSAGVAEALDSLGVGCWINKAERVYLAGVGHQSRFHPNAHVSALIKRIAWEQPAPQPAQEVRE